MPHACESAETVASLRSIVGSLSVVSTSLVPGDLTAEDAATVVEVAARIERHAAAVRTLAVHEVATSKVWKRDGARSCAAWLAARLGVTVGLAHRILGTAHRVRSQPATEKALRAGQLSDDQADAVTGATEADPAGEDQHLHAATVVKESVKDLRRRREQAKAKNEDSDARQQRLVRERSAGGGIGVDGAYRAFLQHTPLDGARFEAAVDAHRQAIIAERQAAGLDKPTWAQLTADAYIRMSDASLGDHRARPTEPAPTPHAPATIPDEPNLPMPAPPTWKPGPLAQISCYVDLTALQRGSVEGDERCEIAGVGPVPVAEITALLGSANLRLVLTRGTDVRNITHRGPPTPAQRAAVYARARGVCEIPDCPNTTYLQIDHLWERQHGGQTELANLALKCTADHGTKTRGQHRLIGPPDRRAWVPLTALAADPAKGHDPGPIEHLLPPPPPTRSAEATPPVAACPHPDEGTGQQRLTPAA